jgi:hypothetical protein
VQIPHPPLCREYFHVGPSHHGFRLTNNLTLLQNINTIDKNMGTH